MTQTEALKSAIEFAEFCLKELDLSYMASNQAKRLVEKAKEALAQPEQEPTRSQKMRDAGHTRRPKGWDKESDEPEQEPATKEQIRKAMIFNLPLYTTPPQRTWVGLTDEEFQLIYDMGRTPAGMMEMVEAKLKEKNT